MDTSLLCLIKLSKQFLIDSRNAIKLMQIAPYLFLKMKQIIKIIMSINMKKQYIITKISLNKLQILIFLKLIFN